MSQTWDFVSGFSGKSIASPIYKNRSIPMVARLPASR